jgi:putative ABC transport system substrate-binding protein
VHRRELILGFGTTACIWPLFARTQQKPMPVIGFLSGGAPGPYRPPNIDAFHQGLSETGYVEGENVEIEYRWAGGRFDRMPALIADLVGRKVDVIAIIAGTFTVQAAKNATSTIPIVFFSGDPVAAGLVASLARPGGNLTGVSSMSVELMAKLFELLSELAPQARVMGLLVYSSSPSAERIISEVQEATRAKGVEIVILNVTTENEIDAAFATLIQRQAGGLLIGPDAFFFIRRDQLVALAARHAIPVIFDAREFPATGGLASYGASLAAANRQVGIYAGKILKGAKPADLPVQQPTRFELVINMKTAKALGLTVPPLLLATADEIIE